VFPNLDGSGSAVTSWTSGTAKYAPAGEYLLTATKTDGSTSTSIVRLTGTTVPSAAAGAGAGTSPPAPVVQAGASDLRGEVTWGTGTTAAPGDQLTVTFSTALAAAPEAVSLTPRNAATQALGLFVSEITAAGFTVATAGDPTDSQAATVYAFDYVVTA
jgi:hypothetical protein